MPQQYKVLVEPTVLAAFSYILLKVIVLHPKQNRKAIILL
jgi:hypothetical protein